MSENGSDSGTRWRAMAFLALAELLAMSVWFSASAVTPSLKMEWRLDENTAAWVTQAVQLGFVVGTLMSALLNLPDIMNPRRLFAICALLASGCSASFGLFAHSLGPGLVLRFLTGFFLAGVYPPGMKIMATWFRSGRGLALGVLIGALTLGKAVPYLLRVWGGEQWRFVILYGAALSALGGLVGMLFVRDGPYKLPSAPFDLSQARRIFSNRGVRLANFGYFGHMWELYAMWTWLPVMLRASFAETGTSAKLAEAASFAAIGAGAAGCVIAGLLADRVGRTLVTSWAMIISGACCIAIGFLFGGSPVALIAITLLWGASVVADSAQFSTCVTELCDQRYIGTALTLQTCIGFLLTTISIQLVPHVLKAVGWHYVFAILAIGPIFGTLSMLRLRSLPEASHIAGGRR